MSFAISCACGKVYASPKVWHSMTPAEKAALKEQIRVCDCAPTTWSNVIQEHFQANRG